MLKNLKIILNDIKNSYLSKFSRLIPILSGFIIVFFIRSILAIFDTAFVGNEYSLQKFIFIGSTTLLILGLEIGFLKFIFNVEDKKTPPVGSIFNYFNLLGQYISGLLLFYLLLLIGFVPGSLFLYSKYNMEVFTLIYNSIGDPYFQELISSYFDLSDLFIFFIVVIIPAFYISIRLSLWSYFVIDKGYNGYMAIKSSLLLTRTKGLELIFYFSLLLIFNFLGILSLIGIFITIPLTYLFLCKYYRLLCHQLS